MKVPHTKKRKTILWYLKKLPAPYRQQAINNTSSNKLLEEAEFDTVSEVLASAFVFSSSKEGGEYWGTLYKHLKAKED